MLFTFVFCTYRLLHGWFSLHQEFNIFPSFPQCIAPQPIVNALGSYYGSTPDSRFGKEADAGNTKVTLHGDACKLRREASLARAVQCSSYTKA